MRASWSLTMNLGIREGCRRVLEPEDYLVETAATGDEGKRKFQEKPFDLVLLDVMMPDVHGIDLLAPIHEQDADTVCIIITGYATIELATRAIKAGAYDFVSKPFTADVLLMTVRQGLERRQLSLEAKRLQAFEQEAAELSRAKQELERMDQFKTLFTLTVAHELRAPITAIHSFLLSFLKGYIPPEQEKQFVQRAVERSRELLNMVDDLLNLAAVTREQELNRRQNLNLADVLEKVLALLKAYADEKRITCVLDIRQCPWVKAQPDQMSQLWTNLISNAIKYTCPGGRVKITLEEQEGWAVGTVEDTGIGIAVEDQDKIFRRIPPHIAGQRDGAARDRIGPATGQADCARTRWNHQGALGLGRR